MNKFIKNNKEEENRVSKMTPEEIKKKLISIFEKCHNILRDQEGIVTLEALNNIMLILFLRLIKKYIKCDENPNGIYDFQGIDISGSAPTNIINPNSYVKYVYYDNIMKYNDLRLERGVYLTDVFTMVFRHVLKHEKVFKSIFKDKFPTIKKTNTYEQILREFATIVF